MNRDTAVSELLNERLSEGFREDIGFGDLTAAVIPEGTRGRGRFTVKRSGVLAGLEAVETGYRLLDASIDIQLLKRDGETVSAGEHIAQVEGPARTLLAGERVILNILQHLSGIATATKRAVDSLEGSNTRICDTRKTIPGIRGLQKYAVRCGGGFNHRMRLDDAVMIKDNHIIAAGGIDKAVAAARMASGLTVKIEVECETAEQVRSAVQAGADIIMLDNKSPDEVRRLCREIPEPVLVELSGGITPETAVEYRDCGADYLSLGSLTHSVTALDISFNLEGGNKLS